MFNLWTICNYSFIQSDFADIFQASENRITGKKTYKLKDSIPLAQAWVTAPSAYYNNPPDTSKSCFFNSTSSIIEQNWTQFYNTIQF